MDKPRLTVQAANALGLTRRPTEPCPCCGRGPGTVIPEPNPWTFGGTDEQWQAEHQLRRPWGNRDEPFCSPLTPCDWCIEWATKQRGSGAPVERQPSSEVLVKRGGKAPGPKPQYLTIHNETRTIAEWSRITGLDKASIYRRLRAGHSAEDAIKSGKQ